MKKFLAILLAMMLVLAMGMTAYASEIPGGENNQEEEVVGGNEGEGGSEGGETTGVVSIEPRNTAAKQDVTIPKAYSFTGSTASLPAHTLSFVVDNDNATVANATAGTTAPEVSIDPITFTADEFGKETEANAKKDLTIHLPEYTATGIYTYSFTETDASVAGIQYIENALQLKVTVIQGENGLELGGIAIRQDDVKTDEIANEYKAGTLEVSKKVTGNAGETAKDFEVTVTFTAAEGETVFSNIPYTLTGNAALTKIDGAEVAAAEGVIPYGDGWTEKTVTFTLRHTDKIKFDNIPEGVAYVVEETDYTGDAYDAATYADSAEGSIAKANDNTVEITNNKTTEVDTGISVDSIPYVLMMVLALAGAAMLVARRREEY